MPQPKESPHRSASPETSPTRRSKGESASAHESHRVALNGIRTAIQLALDDAGDPLSLAERITEAFDRHRIESVRALLDLQQLVQRLAAEAAADDLTGTLRRKAGMAALQREIDRVRREEEHLVLAVVDLDHLKTVNDTEGHLAGNRFLADAVMALREGLRSYDLIIRYGGDEFVCVLPNGTAEDVMERFAAINERLGQVTPARSLSFGLATLQDADDIESLIQRADDDLYQRRSERRSRLPIRGRGDGS